MNQDGPDFALDVTVEAAPPSPGPERHHMLVHGGRLVARRGPHPLPDAAMHTDVDTLQALVGGSLGPGEAIGEGRVRIAGAAAAAIRVGQMLMPAPGAG